MIISFRFNNSRSFFDETVMDMQAVSYKEHPEHLIRIRNKKLIKTLAVYGSNSSGKTNLLLSLASFHSYIYHQLLALKTIGKNLLLSAIQMTPWGQITPFWTLDDETAPTNMELSFVSQGHIYEYGFSIHEQTILREYLSMDNHEVFTRKGEEIHMGRFYEKLYPPRLAIPIRRNCLFCTILSCLDIPQITAVMKPFETYFSEGIQYYFEFSGGFSMFEQAHTNIFRPGLSENPQAQAYALEQLKKLNIPIETLSYGTILPNVGYRIRSHSSGKEGIYHTSIHESSSGTIKYLTLFEQIYERMERGGTMVIDNISNHFHPNVTKYIVDLFQKEANHNTQLIFTTYDVSILNNRQFRRDEVAFVDLNEYNESRLYTLADIKVRSDASFSKDYLLGKYGAIPLIQENP